MESDREQMTESLRETARAEAAPWTDFPPTPAWYPPACGLWVSAFVLTLSVLDDWAQVAGALVLLALAMGWGFWYRRYRGAMPTTRHMPPRFRAPARRFAVSTAVVVLVAALAAGWLPWVGAVVALVGITAVFTWYERAYAEAARATREDLA